MLQRNSKRESRREVGTIRRRQQQCAVEDSATCVGTLDGGLGGAHIFAQKHQSSGGKLRDFDRIQRNVQRVSNIGLPIGRLLWLKGVPNNGIPILEVAVSSENRNALARPVIGKRIVHFAD